MRVDQSLVRWSTKIPVTKSPSGDEKLEKLEKFKLCEAPMCSWIETRSLACDQWHSRFLRKTGTKNRQRSQIFNPANTGLPSPSLMFAWTVRVEWNRKKARSLILFHGFVVTSYSVVKWKWMFDMICIFCVWNEAFRWQRDKKNTKILVKKRAESHSIHSNWCKSSKHVFVQSFHASPEHSLSSPLTNFEQ